ncbi:hypothetical protein ILYODFUR_037903 [Ilyodon furcidens]|uniref:Uncharacterized protein n=1 Tax=Ilyodon furcidens TaxID=33524 RepID=A0ABV0UFV0_9TELE
MPDTPQPDTPQPGMKPDPNSASTFSTCRRERRKRGATAEVIGGPDDATASAHAPEGLGDASAPAHATEGLGDASAPAHATEGPGDTSASVHATESFVLVLASVSRDEGFEEGVPPDPVSGEFKEQLVLVLASEGSPDFVPVSVGPVGFVPVSEGLPDSTPVYQVPGSQPVYEAPGSNPPEFHSVSGGPSMLHGRPPDLPHRGSSTLLGWPPDQPAGSCRSRRVIRPLSRGSWSPA